MKRLPKPVLYPLPIFASVVAVAALARGGRLLVGLAMWVPVALVWLFAWILAPYSDRAMRILRPTEQDLDRGEESLAKWRKTRWKWLLGGEGADQQRRQYRESVRRTRERDAHRDGDP